MTYLRQGQFVDRRIAFQSSDDWKAGFHTEIRSSLGKLGLHESLELAEPNAKASQLVEGCRHLRNVVAATVVQAPVHMLMCVRSPLEVNAGIP